MRHFIGERMIELTRGDITLERVDAVVNAANSELAGGGGVDGAIHRRGGPEIMAETDAKFPKGCPTGSAVITGGGKLEARYVIHAVGPIWQGGQSGEPDLLRSAYARSFQLAAEHACRSIALPAISTGVYGYPMDLASRIALTAASEHLRGESSLEVVRYVLFTAGALGAFAAALDQVRQTS